MERKKECSRSNRMVSVYLNVRKCFKKQHANKLQCFANRLSLDESSNNMDEKIFLKKIQFIRFIGILSLIPRMSRALTFQIFLC